jgi:hypothetical protein
MSMRFVFRFSQERLEAPKSLMVYELFNDRVHVIISLARGVRKAGRLGTLIDGRLYRIAHPARRYAPGDEHTTPISARPPMTLGNMRANGVRVLDVCCWQCHHRTILSADPWPDHVPVPTFGRAWCAAAAESSVPMPGRTGGNSRRGRA